MNEIFPYSPEFEIEKGVRVSYKVVLEHIWPLLTEDRREKISKVAARRNFSLTLVLENIYDRGNASAVMRTQEAFGYPRVEVIEGGERFKNANRVSSGAEKWLHLRKWTHSTDCCKKLKEEGYQLCVTSLQSSKPIDAVDWSKPTALVLGNEKEGVSKELLDQAEERIIIPMQGFVQSFNISVAGAISIYHIHQIHQRMKEDSQISRLTDEQINILKAHYAFKTLDSAPQIIKREFGV